MTKKPLGSIFRLTLFSVITIALAANYSLADAEFDKSLSPYFYIDGNPRVDKLPLKDTDVKIAISGTIADVSVTQKYRNEGKTPINATYIFPASTRAAVYSMRMIIGNEVITAKIRERQQAKKEFEKAKKEGKSASLLEQERPNIFSMKMANLMPNEEIEIELRYTELLVPTKGVYEMVYPTVVGPRYSSEAKSDLSDKSKAPYMNEGENPTSTLHISARISTGVPIQELNCTSHKITPRYVNASTAELKSDDTNPFSGNRDFILRYRLNGKQIESGLLLFEGDDENFFLYMAQPPERIEDDVIPPREYVFVIDVSGSMEGFPLDTSKKLLEELIGRLRPTDFFNVVLFSGDSMALSETPLPANQENVSRAIHLIEQQRGFGGTELLEAMKRTMNLQQRRGVSRSIVVVTDGYISAEKEAFEYIRENLNQSNVFSFGIGSSVNRYLIEGIAKAGIGEPFVVTEASEAEKIATQFREYIQSPVLTDIEITTPGFNTYDLFPLHQPDLMAERPIVVFGKWRGKPTGTFELRGKTGRGDYSTDLNVSEVKSDEANLALRYLWARSKISELSDYNFGPESDEVIEEIKSLGLKYNLLTKYTSFIAIREIIKNPDGSARDVSQRLPLPAGVSNLAVGSEPEFIWIFAAAFILMVLVFLRYRYQLFTEECSLAHRGTGNG